MSDSDWAGTLVLACRLGLCEQLKCKVLKTLHTKFSAILQKGRFDWWFKQHSNEREKLAVSKTVEWNFCRGVETENAIEAQFLWVEESDSTPGTWKDRFVYVDAISTVNFTYFLALGQGGWRVVVLCIVATFVLPPSSLNTARIMNLPLTQTKKWTRKERVFIQETYFVGCSLEPLWFFTKLESIKACPFPPEVEHLQPNWKTFKTKSW